MESLIYGLIGLLIGMVLFLLNRLSSVPKSQFDELSKKWTDLQMESKLVQDRFSHLISDHKSLGDQLQMKREESQKLNSDNVQLQTRLDHGSQQWKLLQQDLEKERLLNQQQQNQLQQLSRSITEFSSQNKFLQEKLESQKQEVEELRKQSILEFQNLANQIMEEKSQKFTLANKENLETILKPLGENIHQFKQKVEETYDKESKQRFSLEEKVKDLIEMNNKLSQEAHNLSSALRGQAKKQGNWGEMILESILEKSGLQKNREYKVQETLYDEHGKMLRPDVIIYLPENRTIIIDSKVSLIAYDRFNSEEDKPTQDIYLQQHVQSVRQHIDDLAKKKYDTLTTGLDFTMLFIPIEPAYILAVQEDNELWNYAYQKRILLISPTNLIAALKLVTDLWKREQQSRNAAEIAKQGERLYEKIVGFLESMEDIGKHINKSQEMYLKAIGQLRDGRGNLVNQAEKLKKLGVKSNKEIPSNLLAFDDEEEDESTEQKKLGQF